MRPSNFPEADTLLVASEGMENVLEMPAYCTGMEVISCWELSPDELAQIQRTGRIWLRVQGETQPPLSLHAESPFVPEQVDAAGDEARGWPLVREQESA